MEVVKIRRRMCLAIFGLRRHPRFDVIFFNLSEPKVATAVDHNMIGKFKRLKKVFTIFCNLFVILNRIFMIRVAFLPAS